MPQILMLMHAAHVNKQRVDARVKKGRTDGYDNVDDAASDQPIFNGKRFDELTSEEYAAYMVAT